MQIEERRIIREMFKIRMSLETKAYAETALIDIGVLIGYTILKVLIILL